MSAIGKRGRVAGRPVRSGKGPGVLARAGRFARGRGGGGMRRHRRRGISATELRGFRKVVGLLRKVGMVPKGTRRAPPRRV
jgi:hypothetical protein